MGVGGVDDELVSLKRRDFRSQKSLHLEQHIRIHGNHVAGNEDHLIFTVFQHKGTGEDGGICSQRDTHVKLSGNGNGEIGGKRPFAPADIELTCHCYHPLYIYLLIFFYRASLRVPQFAMFLKAPSRGR